MQLHSFRRFAPSVVTLHVAKRLTLCVIRPCQLKNRRCMRTGKGDDSKDGNALLCSNCSGSAATRSSILLSAAVWMLARSSDAERHAI
jgi:hypothetical protein